MNDVKENKNAQITADISVITCDGPTELYRLDTFLVLPGCPDLAVGFAFEDGEIDVFSALSGAPCKLYVEDSVTSGAALEYEPSAAIRALLNDLGISVSEDGTFSVDAGVAATARPLTEFDDGVVGRTADTCETMEDLLLCVGNAYVDLEWA